MDSGPGDGNLFDPVQSGEPQVGASPGSVQCLCGWFAKYVGTRHYFDGFHRETMTVQCKRCGTVDIELV